jgi:alpha-D-ribose 1-methylphosphonate 5-triphosphate diphosphatase PhnM
MGKPIEAFNAAFDAAAHAAIAKSHTSGVKTSEFWVTVLGAAAAAVLAIPTLGLGTAGIIAAGAIGVGVSAYSVSRGNVKASLASAGLNALANASKAVPGPMGEAAQVAAAIIGAASAQGQPQK